LDQANQQFAVLAAANGGRVTGTTVVVLYASGQHCAVLWVGDSRIYRLRSGSLSQLTRDHSHVEALIAEGLLERSAAENHPAGNIITRAIGGDRKLDLDRLVDQVLDQDVYLLCSDGLTKEVGPEEITRVLQEAGTGDAAKNLIECALERGGRDNVTAVVIKVEASPGAG
jgi:protein phosphatase